MYSSRTNVLLKSVKLASALSVSVSCRWSQRSSFQSIFLPVYFQAAGADKQSSLLSFIHAVVLFVPLGYLFSRFGLNWFRLTFPVSKLRWFVIISPLSHKRPLILFARRQPIQYFSNTFVRFFSGGCVYFNFRCFLWKTFPSASCARLRRIKKVLTLTIQRENESGRGRRTRTLKNGFGDRYVTITSCP